MGFHSEFIHKNFRDNYIGIDLDYCEIKENRQLTKPKFMLKPKDKSAKFFIFYNHNENLFYFCNNTFNIDKSVTSISLKQIKNKAIFITDSVVEIKLYYYLKKIEI